MSKIVMAFVLWARSVSPSDKWSQIISVVGLWWQRWIWVDWSCHRNAGNSILGLCRRLRHQKQWCGKRCSSDHTVRTMNILLVPSEAELSWLSWRSTSSHSLVIIWLLVASSTNHHLESRQTLLLFSQLIQEVIHQFLQICVRKNKRVLGSDPFMHRPFRL